MKPTDYYPKSEIFPANQNLERFTQAEQEQKNQTRKLFSWFLAKLVEHSDSFTLDSLNVPFDKAERDQFVQDNLELIESETTGLTETDREVLIGRLKDKYTEDVTNKSEHQFITQLMAQRKDFVTSFAYKKNESGIDVPSTQDLDSKVGQLVVFSAGFTNLKTPADVVAVRAGEKSEGGFHWDTGGGFGVDYNPETKTLIVDHHGAEVPNNTSAAEILFKTFDSVGWIPETDEQGQALREPLLRLVDFITKEDNKIEPREFLHFDQGHVMPAMLVRQLDMHQLLSVFRKLTEWNKDAYDILSVDEIKELGLESQSKSTKAQVEQSVAGVETLKNKGFECTSPLIGKILIDPVFAIQSGNWSKRIVPIGYPAARHSKYDAYLLWDPGEHRFFLSSAKEFPQGFKPSYGMIQRRHMWFVHKSHDSVTNVSLVKILKELGVDIDTITPNLRQYAISETVPPELSGQQSKKKKSNNTVSQPAASFNNPFAALLKDRK